MEPLDPRIGSLHFSDQYCENSRQLLDFGDNRPQWRYLSIFEACETGRVRLARQRGASGRFAYLISVNLGLGYFWLYCGF